MYRHYVTINKVKYTFDYSETARFNEADFRCKEDNSFYLMDLGDTKAETKRLQKLYEQDEEGFFYIPIEDVSCIGAEPA